MLWWLVVSQSGTFSIGPFYASTSDANAIRDAVWYAEGQKPNEHPMRWLWSSVDGRWVPG